MTSSRRPRAIRASTYRCAVPQTGHPGPLISRTRAGRREWIPARHAETVKRFATASTTGLGDLADKARVVLAGIVREPRETVVRKGRYQNKKMGLMRLEDLEGSVAVVVFCEAYAKYGEHVHDEAIVFLEGTVDHSREEPSVKVERIIPVERAPETLAVSVTIRFPGAEIEKVHFLRRVAPADGGQTG